MQKRIIPVILAAALFITGLLSILSIHGLQGNARVINYAGVVRGGTQRLVKQELDGQPNDELLLQLDGILSELDTGEGQNGLDQLDDENYQDLISQMQVVWDALKDEIQQVRQGAVGEELFRLSEEYFTLCNQAVNAAEVYAEKQVHNAERDLILLIAVFLIPVALLVWYGARQAKKQQILQKAEAENRAKSEELERMSRDLRAPMDEIPELMYVSDLENYDLLFLNEAGRETFGVKELSGQKCYKVLQGMEKPCEFCTSSKLISGENYTWEYTNPITKRHYLLKDRLLPWDGRPARMELAFDITEADAEKQALKNTLDAEMMVMECVRTLYREYDLDRSVPIILERLGSFLSADRVYVGMIRNERLYNDYEWCADGSTPQKDVLQDMPMSAIASWLPAFERQECFILEDLETLRESSPEEYELLSGQDIHSLAGAPMEEDGQLRGLLGVDNPPPDRIRSIAPLLQTLGYFLMLTYRRTESEKQLSHLSYYDTLTSFYNRNRYMEDSAAISEHAGPVGIVYLDVNGLKDINDQKGHAFGDKVLVECARQMREAFQDADYYRIGGDEFVIICPEIDREVFEQRVAGLRRRFRSNAQCSAAIGAQWDTRFEDLQQIIASADARMYEDKKDFYRKNPVSNRYRHHSDEILHLADPAVLNEEIEQQHFVVYLQPKVASSNGSAVGAEALIRYQPRSDSLVLPGNFLPLLEESETISQIDFYVFEFVCSRFKEWAEQGKQALPVSVNFSRCSLSRPDFINCISGLCRKYGVDKKYMEIELTETAHEADSVDLQNLIRDLRSEGFMVSIDDFGTEYANLALLSTVEFDVLKLDKSLVDDVASNPRASTVVESIVDICKKMNIQVVAEGIETDAQLSALRACGVELAQGYLFSRPVPIEEYENKYLMDKG